MLKSTRSHQDFQQFVTEQLRSHYFKKDQLGTVLLYHLELAKVWVSDLTPVYDILAHRYSKRGSSARDPVDLFRSLLLMELTHSKSVDNWVKTMRAFPIWAIYFGFSPHDVPGVGTFYDFQKRLWLADSPHLSSKIRKPKRKPKKGKKKGEKAPLRKPGIVGRLVSRFLKHPPAPKTQPHDLLQKIFKECFVIPSANQGLLGDITNLDIAGDGSSVRTGASRYGKLVCSCREQKVYNCRCARRYSDPDASWGWDSYREEYYYGRSLYAFTATNSPYDLPVYLNLFKAQRHDSVIFIPAFFDLIRQFPEFNFANCLLDSAHDAYGIYKLLNHHDIGAIIDLNNRNTGNVCSKGNISFTMDGIPVCPKNHIMSYNGTCYDRQRHKWRCPVTRKKWKITCNTPCSTKEYRRVFYTYEQDNLRFFTRIPRKSDQWKAIYKRRTTVERYFKRLKEDYHLETRGKIRSSRAWYFRIFLSSMCLHIDAWVKHQNLDMRPLILRWADNCKALAA